MKILITGSKGFIGRNLIERLNSFDDIKILEFDKNDSLELLSQYCKECDFVFNFAAVHRPQDSSEFAKVNFTLFAFLLNELQLNNNHCPVVYTSSIQSNNGSLYGKSKFDAEQALWAHSKKMKSRGIVYRLTNTFGKYARPYSHSVVATFCANIVNNKELVVTDPSIVMHFAYIDDVIDSFIERLQEGISVQPNDSNIYKIEESKIIDISLGDLASLITSFKKSNLPRTLSNKEKLFYKTYKYYEQCETL